MEIILRKDVIGLGEEGDVKKVKDGYANNYLIPQGFAALATHGNLKKLERERAVIDKRKTVKRNESKGLVDRLEGLKVNIFANASENNKLFGSITVLEISKKLAELGFEIDRKKIEISQAIKTLGNYSAKIKFYEGISAKILIDVLKIGTQPVEEQAIQEETTTTSENNTSESA